MHRCRDYSALPACLLCRYHNLEQDFHAAINMERPQTADAPRLPMTVISGAAHRTCDYLGFVSVMFSITPPSLPLGQVHHTCHCSHPLPEFI